MRQNGLDLHLSSSCGGGRRLDINDHRIPTTDRVPGAIDSELAGASRTARSLPSSDQRRRMSVPMPISITMRFLVIVVPT